MGRLHHLSATVALCTILTVGPDPSQPTEAQGPTVTMTGITPAQVTLAEWALALFADAELRLPDLDIVGHDSTTACMGRNGMHVVDEGRSTIHICTRDAGRIQQFLFLHELAHAWDRANLSAERRLAFLEQRGLTEWNNLDADRWHDRGGEHAAEIIAWGLIDRPVGIVRISGTSCAELLAGYVTLVGESPLHGTRTAAGCRRDAGTVASWCRTRTRPPTTT